MISVISFFSELCYCITVIQFSSIGRNGTCLSPKYHFSKHISTVSALYSEY